jgi:hypothetical protein
MERQEMSNYRVIWYKVPDNLIGGPYRLNVLNSLGQVVSACGGMPNRAWAERRANQYADSFGTLDVSEVRV